jgi:hypothetical protein
VLIVYFAPTGITGLGAASCGREGHDRGRPQLRGRADSRDVTEPAGRRTGGLLGGPQGLYDESRLDALDISTAVRLTRVDTNHHGVVLVDPGVSAVVDALERRLDAAG